MSLSPDLKALLEMVEGALTEIKSQGEWAHNEKGAGLCGDYTGYGRCAPNSICDVKDTAQEALTAIKSYMEAHK